MGRRQLAAQAKRLKVREGRAVDLVRSMLVHLSHPKADPRFIEMWALMALALVGEGDGGRSTGEIVERPPWWRRWFRRDGTKPVTPEKVT